MHTIDTQAATQDSTTSTGAQATYNNWVVTPGPAVSVYALHPHQTSTKLTTCQTVYPQFLQPMTDINRGLLAQR